MKQGIVAAGLSLVFAGTTHAGMTPECKSAQDYAKQQLHNERLDVNDIADGAYEAAVRSRRMYEIILGNISGVCPQGAVDHYQSQYDKAHASACQFSATDSVCQMESAKKEEEKQQAQQEVNAGQQEAQMEACRERMEAQVYREVYNNALIVVKSTLVKALLSEGVCPDIEETRAMIAAYETNEKHSAEAQRIHNARKAQGDDDDDSSILGIIGAAAVGAASGYIQGQAIQQQMQQPSGGSRGCANGQVTSVQGLCTDLSGWGR